MNRVMLKQRFSFIKNYGNKSILTYISLEAFYLLDVSLEALS